MSAMVPDSEDEIYSNIAFANNSNFTPQLKQVYIELHSKILYVQKNSFKQFIWRI